MTARRTVLITGCSEGGIGAAVALEYQQRGCHVFATARNTRKIPTAITSLPNVTILSLDVTSPQSINDAVREVSKVTGGRLDVLINNSGVAMTASTLDTDIEAARAMFDVNVIGVLATTQAFSALLTKRRDACVVIISSINGETNLPFGGVYGASKAAATIMAESLRLEVAPLGVRVVTVVTGIIETKLHDNEPKNEVPADSFYQPVAGWINGRKTGANRPPGMPVEEYAKQFVRRIEGGASGKIYIGPLTPLFVYLKWWMPTFIWDYFMVQSGPEKGNEKIAHAFNKRIQ